jgi:glucosylceramidase
MHDETDATRRRFLRGGLALAAASTLPRELVAGEQSAPRWTLIETARDSDHRQARIEAPAPAPSGTGAMLSCGKEAAGPAIVGFGGALTESAAHVLAQLPKAKREEVLRSYYDPATGIGYTLARTHIGSCDFSLSSWSLDDTADDRSLRHFSLAPMRKAQLPLIHDVLQIVGKERFKLLASPWSPPAWMKDNRSVLHGGSLREDCAAAWADHYVRFVRAMRDGEKLPVWALTVQNEPDASQPWESCLYSAREERDFIAGFLGPALEKAHLGDVKLFGWDHNRDGLLERAVIMLGDPHCAKYLAGLALHWYQSEDFGASRQVLTRFPDKQVLFTEGCVEGGAHAGEWEPAERYARNMIGDFNNGVCGFIDWNIALDMQGGPNHAGNFCHAPVLVDTASGEVQYQPSFHYIAHFSKYVAPGARRLQLAKKDKSLQTIAFVNPDGSRVIVVCNPADDARDFTLAVDDDVRACRVPARGIHTYVVAA